MVELTENMKDYDEGSVFELFYTKVKEDNFERKMLPHIGHSHR